MRRCEDRGGRAPRTVRALLRTALGLVLAGASACAARPGSSFETLGVPEPELRPGRATVIFGWDREDRAGWVIRSLRLNRRQVPGWEVETQRPLVMYVRPGSWRLAFVASRPAGPDRPGRRSRSRPVELELEAGRVHLCVARVRPGQGPEVGCTVRATTAGEAGPEGGGGDGASSVYALFDRPGAAVLSELAANPYGRAAGAGAEGAGGPLDDDPEGRGAIGEERLRGLEERLERLERLVEGLLRGRGATEPSPPEPPAREVGIDTSPPW